MTSLCCEKEYIALPKDILNFFFEFSQTLGPFNNVRQRVQDDDGPRLLLWELLIMFRSQEATDPRDKVYALLGLVTEWLKKKPLLPDYSLTASEVNKKAVLEIITDMESLLVLTDCVKKDCSPQMPSWVPDWTASQGLGEANLEWACVVTRFFNASGSRKAHPTLFGDSILGLAGMKLGTVCHSAAVLPEPFSTLVKWRNTAEALWSALGESGRPYPSGGSWQNAFSRTVLGDLISPITNGLVEPGNARAFRRAQQEDIDALETFCAEIHASTSCASIVDYYNQANDRVKELITTFVNNIERQGYFMTLNSYMGLGPNTVCAGDEVWVLMGSPVPFVLRPLLVKESDEVEPQLMHQLVGHCFVHGIMDGEATKNFLHKVDLVGIV